MATFTCTDIGALQDLLEQDIDVLGPSQTQVAPRVGAAAVATTSTKANKDTKLIWDDNEVPTEETLGFMFDPNDQRRRADFKMFYKQLVNSGNSSHSSRDTPPLLQRTFIWEPKKRLLQLTVKPLSTRLLFLIIGNLKLM